MRGNSQVLIYIDVSKAIAAGIKFHRSANGVILSEGNDRGFIPPEYFSRIDFPPKKDKPKGTNDQAVTQT